MKLLKYSIFLYLIFCNENTVFSQSFKSNTNYQLESGIYLSTSKQLPFGLRTNQYGIVPFESQVLTLRGSVHKEYDSIYVKQQSKKPFLNYGYGLNTVINVGRINQILLPEAYLKVKHKALEFYIGRRKESFGLVDSTLTSGSYIWSGNALPMPKVQISIPNYVPLFGNNIVSIKGGFAHGWFDNGYVKNYYLHQKWFYGRFGKPNWRMKFYAGLNHQVQWGGKPMKPYIEAKTGALISKFPSDFATYLKVVSGVSLNQNDSGTSTGLPLNEAWNRAGNHLGTLDISSEINFKMFDLFLYRQSIYEDGSLFYLNNISDGLFGFSVKRKGGKDILNRICFEYLNTTSQGGSTGSENTISQLRGQDNYFNNSLYLNAWTYKHNMIGTPLITPLNQANSKLINNYTYGDVPQSFIVNNRVRGFNVCLSGKIHRINFITKLIWTNNLGLYNAPFNAKQFSFLQQIQYKLPQYTIITHVAFDKGSLYLNSLGGYIGIRRTFF